MLFVLAIKLGDNCIQNLHLGRYIVGYVDGNLILRRCFPGSYVLSLRDYDATKGDCVKHYKMRNMENGGVYIAARRTFSSIIELVEHYKG